MCSICGACCLLLSLSQQEGGLSSLEGVMSEFFIYAYWVFRQPYTSCTDWKLIKKVCKKECKHNLLVFFFILFFHLKKNHFNIKVSIIGFMGETILWCSLQKQKTPWINFHILPPYSSATSTVNCLDIYILSVSLIELLCDSSSKAEATTSNQRPI